MRFKIGQCYHYPEDEVYIVCKKIINKYITVDVRSKYTCALIKGVSIKCVDLVSIKDYNISGSIVGKVIKLYNKRGVS